MAGALFAHQGFGIIFLILAAILPGSGLAALLSRSLERWNTGERFVLVVLLSVMQCGAISFLCALASCFSLPALWFSIGSLSLLWIVLAGVDAIRRSYPLSDWKSIVLVLSAGFLFYASTGAPAQWMLNAHLDAGRYSNIASFVVQNGSFRVPLHQKEYTEDLHNKMKVSDVPGFFRLESQPERVLIGPYVHFFPATLAFVRAHIGTRAGFSSNFVFAVLSAGAFYLLVFEIWGSRLWALIAAIMLFSNPAAQMYFTRSMTETLAQMLFCEFALLSVLAQRTQSTRVGILSACVYLCLCVTRLEFGIILALPALCIFATAILGRRSLALHEKSFIGVLVIGLGFLLSYYSNFAFVYASGNAAKTLRIVYVPLGYTMNEVRPFVLWLVSIINAVLFVIGVVVYGIVQRWAAVRDWCSKNLTSILLLGWLLFIVWNIFVRAGRGPVARPELRAGYDHEKINLQRLLYFFDGLSFACGIVGLQKLSKKSSALPVLLFGMLFTMLSLVESGHSAPVLWWVRRYLPVTVPFLYLLAVSLWSTLPQKIACCVVLPSLLFNFTATSIVARGFQEKKGSYHFYAHAAKVFGANDLQVCFGTEQCSYFAVPLQSHFGIESVYLPAEISRPSLELLVEQVKKRGRVFISFASKVRDFFSDEDRALFQEFGLQVRTAYQGRFVAQDPDTLNKQWRVGDPWWKLYIPWTLWGVEFQETRLPVRIVEVTLKP